VKDIADGIAQAFPPQLEGGITKAVQTLLVKEMSKYPHFTLLPVFKDNLQLDLRMRYYSLPSRSVLFGALSGGFTVVGQQPPFVPDYTPSNLGNLDDDFTIMGTEYLFQSLAWSLSVVKFFDRTIPASVVPPDSPVKLSTNDAFFQGAVPYLVHLPNMDITITTTLTKYATPTLYFGVVRWYGQQMNFEFVLSNSTTSIPGWTLSHTFDVDVAVTATGTARSITFIPSIKSLNATSTVAASSLGTVYPEDFPTLYQLIASAVKIPSHTLTFPEGWTIANPGITFAEKLFWVVCSLQPTLE